MQKNCLLLLLLLLGSLGLFAQKNNQPHSPAQKIIDGFTVQLRPAPGNTYLFDFLQGPVPVNIPMINNPVTMLPKGFASKEDAYKVAEWMVKQYKKDGHIPGLVPPHVLDELKIERNSLYHN